MKDIKIAFIDIDGTLTNSKKIITQNTIDVLKKASNMGIEIVLCSGRTNEYVYNFSKQIPNTRYIISSNGAEVFDYITQSDLYSNLLPFDCIRKVWDYASKNNIGCVFNTSNLEYTNNFSKYISNPNKKIINNINNLENINIYQIVIVSDNYLEMEKAKEFIEKQTALKIINLSSCFLKHDINSNYYFFDVVTKNTSKGNAIDAFLKFKNFSKENVICFR